MNKSFKTTAQAGFTLIELIVVIVILGILAATAMPKFMNLGGDARAATLNAARGGVNSIVSLAHARFLANTTGTALTTTTVEGETLTYVHGYPAADAGFAKIAAPDFKYKVNATASPVAATTNEPAVPAKSVAIWPASVDGTATAVTCMFTYSEPTAAGTLPTVTNAPAGDKCE